MVSFVATVGSIGFQSISQSDNFVDLQPGRARPLQGDEARFVGVRAREPLHAETGVGAARNEDLRLEFLRRSGIAPEGTAWGHALHIGTSRLNIGGGRRSALTHVSEPSDTGRVWGGSA